jgi:two-component system, NtrC family, sensor kinase
MIRNYLKIGSSIYSRVIYIIIFLSLLMFASFGVIFMSVNDQYMNTVIKQRGSNVGLIVRGSLYHSMLENDSTALRKALNIINKMSGIDDVNLYDKNENLKYSSFSIDTFGHSDPECKKCHSGIASLFEGNEQNSKIIEISSECKMNQKNDNNRHLLIRSPILNEPSCYTSECHAHNRNERELGSLVIKIPLKDLDESKKRISYDYYILASAMTILMLVLLIFFTRKKIKKPLNSLIQVSEAVSKGDRSSRVEISSDQLDDMRMVSLAFNDMLDNLQSASTELQNWSQQLEYKVQKKTEELGNAQNELINIERIASLGKLSLSVAHEINNPLSGILIYTKLLHKQLTGVDMEPTKKELILKHLKIIESETKRCGDIVKGLLDFSRKDQNKFEHIHLHEVLRETCDLLAHSMKMAKIIFHTDFAATSDLVYCNPNQIKQACIAILVNAIEAVSENGEIVLRTVHSENGSIAVEIIDNGCGISSEDMDHIFEPFYTTKENARGTGLGLAIVHGIIQNHNSKIKVQSEPGKGTTFIIQMPLSDGKNNIL